jgi:hypothetical protein
MNTVLPQRGKERKGEYKGVFNEARLAASSSGIASQSLAMTPL